MQLPRSLEADYSPHAEAYFLLYSVLLDLYTTACAFLRLSACGFYQFSQSLCSQSPVGDRFHRSWGPGPALVCASAPLLSRIVRPLASLGKA